MVIGVGGWIKEKFIIVDIFSLSINWKMNYYSKKRMEGSIWDGFVGSIFDLSEININ